MRKPLGSRYHTQPAINAFQVGRRLAGCSGTWFAVGHTGPPRKASAGALTAGLDGTSVSSRVRGSVADYLARFEFRSELLVAMYAVTDGLSGLTAGPDDPGTGNNFLAHNMCRLPGSDGTWMIAAGGMGTVSRTFAEAATRAGATIVAGTPVAEVLLDGGAV